MKINTNFIESNKVYNFIELCYRLGFKYKFTRLYNLYTNMENADINYRDIDKIFILMDLIRTYPKVPNIKLYYKELGYKNSNIVKKYMKIYEESRKNKLFYVNNKTIENQLECIKEFKKIEMGSELC